MTFMGTALGGRALERDREPGKDACSACEATSTFFALGLEHEPAPKCPRCGKRWEVVPVTAGSAT